MIVRCTVTESVTGSRMVVVGLVGADGPDVELAAEI
jgi:hypothetical protein